MNMNLDSIHRLIEESQIVQMQQSSMKARCDVTEPASSPKDTCRSSLPVYGRPSHVTPNFRAHSFTTNKWDICEELRLRELEEAKARAAQMEKTMRWWSDCTANWREKWSKVRAERNSAREEARQLRVKLEMTVKELSTLKKKQRMPLQKEASDANVSQDLELPSFLEESYDHRDQSQRKPQGPGAAREHLMKRETDEQNTNSKEDGAVTDPLGVKEDRKPNPDCADLFMKGGSPICAVSPVLTLPAANLCLGNEVTESSASRVHSVECQKIFWKEREMRAALEKEVERLESALSLWKWKYEELKKLKAASTREFDAIHGQHENDSEKERTAGDVWEECQFQNSKDRVICESRTKVREWIRGEEHQLVLKNIKF